jgi:hypothetical protein
MKHDNDVPVRLEGSEDVLFYVSRHPQLEPGKPQPVFGYGEVQLRLNEQGDGWIASGDLPNKGRTAFGEWIKERNAGAAKQEPKAD